MWHCLKKTSERTSILPDYQRFFRFFKFFFYFLETFLKNNFCLSKYLVIASLVSSSNANTRILKTHIKKCRQASFLKF